MISVGDFTPEIPKGSRWIYLVPRNPESLDSDSNLSRVEQPLPPGRALGQRVKVSAYLEMFMFLGPKTLLKFGLTSEYHVKSISLANILLKLKKSTNMHFLSHSSP